MTGGPLVTEALSPPLGLGEIRHGGRLTLSRAWPRAAGHALVEYLTDDGQALAGQWIVDADHRRKVLDHTPGATEVDGLGVVLQPDGADRKLVVLAELATAPGAHLLVHRPERRAVVRAASGCYLKIIRPRRAASMVEILSRVTEAAGASDGAFGVATLLRSDPASGMLVFGALPGASLYDRQGGRFAESDWAAAGRAVTALHHGATGGAARHDAAAEAEVTRRWVSHAIAFGVMPAIDPEPRLAPLLHGSPTTIGLLHRDLHDKQLLVEPGEPIGMLDVDTVSVGERALDLANLLVHLELRLAQGRLTGTEAASAADAFLAGAAPDAATHRRIPDYAAAARLRLGALYAFRPRWRAVASRLLTSSRGSGPLPASASG